MRQRKSAEICAVSSRFETTKLNSDHDKFRLGRSLSNSSKAPLDNNTFAIETLFFFSKMLSNQVQIEKHLICPNRFQQTHLHQNETIHNQWNVH